MKNLALLFLWASFLGCAKGSESHLENNPNHESLKSSLTENFSSNLISSCDLLIKDQALALADDLDRRYADIKSILTAPRETESYRRIPIGPLFVRFPKQEVKGGADTWETEEISWDHILALYQKTKNSGSNENWVRLYSQVQSILLSDHLRLIDELNFELDKDSHDPLTEAIKVVNECSANTQCTSLEFKPSIKSFLMSKTSYAALLTGLDYYKSLPDKRAFIEELEYRLKFDDDYFYHFDVSKAVARISKTDFEISLDPGDFKGFESQIAKIMLKVWSSQKYHIHIKWSDSKSDPNAIALRVDGSIGARNITNVGLRYIYYSQDTTAKGMAHEFGHALGFPDHYFSVWNPETCKYVEQINRGDIMSADETGEVTTAEWDGLDKHYPSGD